MSIFRYIFEIVVKTIISITKLYNLRYISIGIVTPILYYISNYTIVIYPTILFICTTIGLLFKYPTIVFK